MKPLKQAYKEGERDAYANAMRSGEALRDGVTDFLKTEIKFDMLTVFVFVFLSLLVGTVAYRMGFLPFYPFLGFFMGSWTAALSMITYTITSRR